MFKARQIVHGLDDVTQIKCLFQGLLHEGRVLVTLRGREPGGVLFDDRHKR